MASQPDPIRENVFVVCRYTPTGLEEFESFSAKSLALEYAHKEAVNHPGERYFTYQLIDDATAVLAIKAAIIPQCQ